MAFEKCVTSFNDITGLDLTDEENKRILQEIMRAKERIVAERGLASKEALNEAAQEIADKQLLAARMARLESLNNLAKRKDVMKDVERFGGINQAAEVLHALLRGSNKTFRESIESLSNGKRDTYLAAINNALFKTGLKKVAESGELDKDIAIAWWKINAKENPGIGPAAEIATIYSKALNKVREDLNSVGARVGEATDYVTKTTHDPVAMRQAAGTNKTSDEAFKVWWGKTLPRLAKKTFDDVFPEEGGSIQQAIDKFGRSVFDALVTGVHMKVGGEAETGFVPAAFEGTHNLARRLSQERTLFWKDAESWYGHMQDFGQFNNLNASVQMSAARGARAWSLMNKLGTNPEANLNQIVRKVQEKYRSDVDAVNKFQTKIGRIKAEMSHLDGTANIPQNMGLAKTAQAIRTWESVSSLGGVGITHLVSTPVTVTSELFHHGVSRLESFANLAKSLVTGMGDQERRNLMSELGAYVDGAVRHTYSQFGDDGTLPGKVSSMAGRFMDMTGVHAIMDRTKAGTRSLLSHNLARNLQTAWGKLDPHLSGILSKYGISSADWTALKDVELRSYNDRQYLVPAAANDIKDETVERILRDRGEITKRTKSDLISGKIQKYKDGLSDKIMSYYSDGASHSVVTAGVREKALLLGNSQRGTGVGESLRFFAQFKSWPLAAMHQIMEREIYMSLSNKEAAWNIGKIVAIGIPAGYARMLINDLATGHPPRDPRDPKTLMAAAAQSGGLGIFGDYLFGETNRMGGNILSTLGGPVATDADVLWRIFNKAKTDTLGGGAKHKTGAYGDIWPDLAHFAVRHIPFANLVYLKGAMDYMLWYHLYEAASPGWWERTNRRLQKEQGRTMMGYVPGGGVPTGVPGVYLKAPDGPATGVLASRK